MISSMSVPICSRFHTIRANSGKITPFRGYLLLTPSFKLFYRSVCIGSGAAVVSYVHCWSFLCYSRSWSDSTFVRWWWPTVHNCARFVGCRHHCSVCSVFYGSRCVDEGQLRLRLNAEKTQLIWLGTWQQLEKLPTGDVQLLSASVRPQSVDRDLGVNLDSQLTMADHVTTVCRAGYYQLRKLCQIIQSLTPTVAQTLVQAFISCRLDYCNSLLYGIADSQLWRLQFVQNAAARLITGTRRAEHTTPVLQSLQWLPVRQRILFKLAMLVHKCLNGRAPAYLADDWRLIRYRRSGLRSSSATKLEVPPTRTTFGDRSFAVDGPRVWNSLPASIRDPSLTLAVFSNRLKTHLFEQWLRRLWLWTDAFKCSN